MSTEAETSGQPDRPEPRYTHGHHESVLRSHRWRTAENSAAYLLPHLRPGLSLLDVGSGPGTLTADLAGLVAPGPVTAVEVSADALELTRAELDRRGVEGVGLVVSDAHALDLPGAAFDVVHAHQVLQHVADPVAALRELRRVRTADGVIAVRDSDYAGFVWWPRVPELDDWLALYETVARANGGEPDAGRRLRSWALEAGCTDVTASSSTWCFTAPEDRTWWGDLWAERVTESAFAEQALDSGAATAADLRRLADGWRRWAAAPDGWLSLLHGEVLARG
jgi:SAM-dependent methyltransferase